MWREPKETLYLGGSKGNILNALFIILQMFRKLVNLSLRPTVPFFSLCLPPPSGVIDRIRQIGVEFHEVGKFIYVYAKIVKRLSARGFKIISWEPNFTTQRGINGYDFFEVVFRKTEICSKEII